MVRILDMVIPLCLILVVFVDPFQDRFVIDGATFKLCVLEAASGNHVLDQPFGHRELDSTKISHTEIGIVDFDIREFRSPEISQCKINSRNLTSVELTGCHIGSREIHILKFRRDPVRSIQYRPVEVYIDQGGVIESGVSHIDTGHVDRLEDRGGEPLRQLNESITPAGDVKPSLGLKDDFAQGIVDFQNGGHNVSFGV